MGVGITMGLAISDEYRAEAMHVPEVLNETGDGDFPAYPWSALTSLVTGRW